MTYEILKKKAFEILAERELPPSVNSIARELDISWTTARQILLELALEGEIEARKTEKSWIFEIVHDQESQPNEVKYKDER